MPYTCRVDGGEVSLTPGPERGYAIIGQREELPFDDCSAETRGGQCRTFMVHRFTIDCGGSRVPWVRVVAAAQVPRLGRTWLADGRLNIQRESRSAGAARPCVHPATAAVGRMGPPTREEADCLSSGSAGRKLAAIVLPAGFAPVGEFGARLAFQPAGSRQAEVATDDLVTGAIPGPGTARFARYDYSVAKEPLPEIGAPDTLAQATWETVIEATDLSQGPAGSTPALPGTAAVWLALAGTLTATGWLTWRRRLRSAVEVGACGGPSTAAGVWRRVADLASSAPRSFRARTLDDVGDPNLINAARQVAALLDQIEKAVRGLKEATPLREVLEQELRLIHHRLGMTKAAALSGTGPADRAAAQFRGLVRELERVRRIANGAAASLSASREALGVPQTKSEAYAILGVNPDVTEATLKKLVDALRMTWHPDHARDENDLILRESRMKQINIAWELINDRRHQA